jgi:CO/xanthine dehydrogenase Mo-binding subunit
MLWASRRIGRPVKWTQTRNEAHISDDDARDNIVDAALALDRDGKFLAVMTFVTGSISHGQGHATIQTQMLVGRLGVDPEPPPGDARQASCPWR